MANSGIQIPPELMVHVQERSKLWGAVDAVKTQEAILRGLSSKVDAKLGSPENVGPLSKEQTAPSEMQQALQKLNAELKEIEGLQNKIKDGQNKIGAINTHYRNMMIGIVITIIIVLAVVANSFA